MVQVHSFIASTEKRYNVFPFLPLDPALDIGVFRPLFISKQDKQPKREEIKKIKMDVVLSLGPAST